MKSTLVVLERNPDCIARLCKEFGLRPYDLDKKKFVKGSHVTRRKAKARV